MDVVRNDLRQQLSNIRVSRSRSDKGMKVLAQIPVTHRKERLNDFIIYDLE